MIKAIDAQQVVIQSEQANRVQQIDRQHPGMEHGYQAVQVEAEKKVLQKAISNPREAAKTIIRDDEQGRRNPRQGESSNKEAKQTDENTDDAFPEGGEHINIRV